ncbi:MAG: TonB-dependent receptor, partial [Hymenobacteraceae bacterium]|nr:TonB-dependent receptor [Hymenobacteraceae bacterium]MDX5394603.1 TonB-dependent receptor [Hymenobacteraceae bacterium]MDX5510631.1 TonB-dependent receptor [Hymenobacteraceae bacterium]
KSTLKFVTFSGTEKTYQAWYGTPEALVYGDSADLQNYIARNWITGSDSANLVSSGRKYNYYTYDNETDNYQQDHYQLHFSHDLATNLNFGGALHYTYGRGYYEQYRKDDDLADYNLPAVAIGGDTITTSDIIRRRWLDNDFYGVTYALNYMPTGNLTATVGGAWNRYLGGHFGELIWARYASTSEIRHRYYENDAEKTDFNIFGKINYQPVSKIGLFADLQFRSINYNFLGFDNDLEQIDQSVDFNFWNPKAGITYSPTQNHTVYGSYAVGNREPVRDDFTESTPNSRPKHETLHNIEVGYRTNGKLQVANVAMQYQAEVNVFNMNYDNQLVLTGQINDVGAYTRTNIKDSYRRGVEFAGALGFAEKVTLSSSLAYSQNKVEGYQEFVDDYDTGEQLIRNFSEKTDIAFSPEFVSNTELEVRPLKGLELAFIYRTVGKQYLDNTSNEDRVIPAYQVGDLRFRYRIGFKNVLKELQLGLLVNNVFSEKYAANGYTFSYIYDQQLTTENFYYPQATRNFLVSVGLKF